MIVDMHGNPLKVSDRSEKVIYAFGCEGNKVKIGITTNCNQRIKALCKIKPSPLQYVYISKEFNNPGYSKEREIHAILNKYQINGEWFDIDLQTAKKVIDSICGEGGCLSTRKSFFSDFNIVSSDYN